MPSRNTSVHESQLAFHYGEYQSTLLIGTVFEQLKVLSRDEPWVQATTIFNNASVHTEEDLTRQRLDQVVTLFKATGFTEPTLAATLLKMACKIQYDEAPSQELREMCARNTQNGRANSQKLTRIPRTAAFDGNAKIRITKLMNATLGDLGPIPHGSVVGYTLRKKLGVRLLTVANLLLEDGSQRHNLDYDVRDWMARYLNRYFPGDGSVEDDQVYLRNKWRNLRGSTTQVPGKLIEDEEAVEFFNLAELIEKGKITEETVHTLGGSFGEWSEFYTKVRDTERLLCLHVLTAKPLLMHVLSTASPRSARALAAPPMALAARARCLGSMPRRLITCNV